MPTASPIPLEKHRDRPGCGLVHERGNVTGVALLAAVDPTWTVVGIADFNADGKPDVLWRNTATGLVAVWYMNG